jgi:hypothetical protein
MSCSCIKANQSGDLKQLVDAVLKYSPSSTSTIRITHMEGEEIFGSYKQKANLTPGLKGDSHRRDRVNFSHPCVSHTIVSSNLNIETNVVDQIEKDVEVLEDPCGDGVWHIMLHVQCSTLQKSNKHYCVTRIITKSTSIGVRASTYSMWWSQFPYAPLKLHKF